MKNIEQKIYKKVDTALNNLRVKDSLYFMLYTELAGKLAYLNVIDGAIKRTLGFFIW